jgi:hypothetical protein
MQHGLGLPTLGLGQLENDTVIRKSRQSGSVETPGRIKRQAGLGNPPIRARELIYDRSFPTVTGTAHLKHSPPAGYVPPPLAVPYRFPRVSRVKVLRGNTKSP